MKIVTAAEMREIDRATSERFGVPSITLMENAGSAVADFVLATYPWAGRISVVCGKGNNGGDGFVVARKLRDRGKEIALLLLCDPQELSGDAAETFQRAGMKPVVVQSSEDLHSPGAQAVFTQDVLVDAILGTGFRPPASGLYGEAIAALNASSKPVVAVDIPSGANADAMLEQPGLVAKADAVVTFTAPRPAHVFMPLTKGPTVCSPIGSPEEAIASSLNLHVATAHDFAEMLAPRPADSNKGSYGHVLVVGGSRGKAGAAAMAGFSVLRAGAGLSTIATSKSALSTVASFHPEVMTEPLDETEAGTISMKALELAGFAELLKGKTVVACGMGLSRQSETAAFVRALVAKCELPMVLDADGLNAFEGHADELSGTGRSLIITPHPGEMARLAGCSIRDVQQDRLKTAGGFAHEHGLIVVLKGNRTVVAAPDGTAWVNTTGNPGMATGGTGDVLTGVIASLIAQHPQRILDATVMGVFLHGLAGDVACEAVGEEPLVATDVIRFLPNAFRRARQMGAEKMVRIA